MKQFFRQKENLIAALLVFIGAVLRLYRLNDFSLSVDEFETLNKIGFSSWGSGTPVFLLRLPFALMGIASILMVYSIAKKWFNTTTALFSASAIALLQYPVLHSQTVSAYALGFFLLLVKVWSVTHLLSPKVKKNNRFYLLSAITLIVLVGLYIHQKILDTDLSKPLSNYWQKFLFYSFNNSTVVVIAVCFAVLFSLVLNWQKIINLYRYQLLCIAMSFVPFIILYYFSVYVHPLIQYPVLLLFFPYFLMYVFSYFKEDTPFKYLIIAVFSGVLLFSTIFEKDHYNKQHGAEFKQLAYTANEWNSKCGAGNIISVTNISDPGFIQYYLDEISSPLKFKKTKVAGISDFLAVKKMVEESETPYFMYSWSGEQNFGEAEYVIRQNYPALMQQKLFWLDDKCISGIQLFKKDSAYQRKIVFESVQDFEKKNKKWSESAGKIEMQKAYNIHHSLVMDEAAEYSSTFTSTLGEITNSNTRYINVSTIFLMEPDVDAELVVSIDSKIQSYAWKGVPMKYFIENTGWNYAFACIEIPKTADKSDIVKVYVWNKNKKRLTVDNITVVTYND